MKTRKIVAFYAPQVLLKAWYHWDSCPISALATHLMIVIWMIHRVKDANETTVWMKSSSQDESGDCMTRAPLSHLWICFKILTTNHSWWSCHAYSSHMILLAELQSAQFSKETNNTAFMSDQWSSCSDTQEKLFPLVKSALRFFTLWNQDTCYLTRNGRKGTHPCLSMPAGPSTHMDKIIYTHESIYFWFLAYPWA